MSGSGKRHGVGDGERYRTVTAARERFLAGDDRVRGVRPEVATSWYRCREQYHVDPGLDRAPPASAHEEPSTEHTLEHEVVFANLGGAAASIAPEVENLGGVVTVTDGVGRILTIQGDVNTLRQARESNMAPWSCWSEWATGTNGMGTALEAPGPVLISGPEHWCAGFDEWVCGGVAVRDPVTDDAVAVLDVSTWRHNLPAQAAGWLSNAVSGVRAILRQRAHDTGAELAAAFAQASARSGQALAALDASGKVVIADEEASLFLGVPSRVTPPSRLVSTATGSARRRSRPGSAASHARSRCARSSSPTSRSGRWRCSDSKTATRSSPRRPSAGSASRRASWASATSAWSCCTAPRSASRRPMATMSGSSRPTRGASRPPSGASTSSRRSSPA